MAPAAQRRYHRGQQRHHPHAHHGILRALRLQPLPELRLPGEPGLQPRDSGLQPEFRVADPFADFPNISMTSQYSLGTNNNFFTSTTPRTSPPASRSSRESTIQGRFDYRRIHNDGNDLRIVPDSSPSTASSPAPPHRQRVSGTGDELRGMLLGAASSGSGYIPSKLYEFADYSALTSRTIFASPRRFTVKLRPGLGTGVRIPGDQQPDGGRLRHNAVIPWRQCQRISPKAHSSSPESRQQHPRQPSQHEQVRAAHGHRVAIEFQDYSSRRLRTLLGPAICDRDSL